MRHGSEVREHDIAIDVFSQSEGDLVFGIPECRVIQQLSQGDGHLDLVRDFDPDGVFSGDGRDDIDALGFGGTGDIGLECGDILITGTPSGVALAREDPQAWFLRSGQLIVARIEKLGELRNRMR